MPADQNYHGKGNLCRKTRQTAQNRLPAVKNAASQVQGSLGDAYGRTGRTQVLHIDLIYADGSKGVLNLISPHVVDGHDIELQCRFAREYLATQHKSLGIVGYHPHCATVTGQGVIKVVWSWFPFDLVRNQEVRPEPCNAN